MCYAHLTQRGRYQIQARIQAGESVQAIANALHVHRSTIYRERKRGADRHGHYSAARAQRRARQNQRRSAANHPVKPVVLWRRVERKIRRDWAPVHVRGWLNLNTNGDGLSGFGGVWHVVKAPATAAVAPAATTPTTSAPPTTASSGYGY
jgi:IS30 family transposase